MIRTRSCMHGCPPRQALPQAGGTGSARYPARGTGGHQVSTQRQTGSSVRAERGRAAATLQVRPSLAEASLEQVPCAAQEAAAWWPRERARSARGRALGDGEAGG